MSKQTLRAGLIIFLCLLITGCFRFSWQRELRFEPPAPTALESLRAGETDLAQALRALGAPLWVWESDNRSAALAYGWYEGQTRGFRISVSVDKPIAPSFDYNRIDSRLRGLVLFFDENWKLRFWRTGLLRDLSAEIGRRRPVNIDEQG